MRRLIVTYNITRSPPQVVKSSSAPRDLLRPRLRNNTNPRKNSQNKSRRVVSRPPTNLARVFPSFFAVHAFIRASAPNPNASHNPDRSLARSLISLSRAILHSGRVNKERSTPPQLHSAIRRHCQKGRTEWQNMQAAVVTDFVKWSILRGYDTSRHNSNRRRRPFVHSLAASLSASTTERSNLYFHIGGGYE